jgi:hypothetical protein
MRLLFGAGNVKNLHWKNVFDFLTATRRVCLLILHKIFLIFVTFPVWIMHCFLRNTPFRAHYIMGVPSDRGAP